MNAYLPPRAVCAPCKQLMGYVERGVLLESEQDGARWRGTRFRCTRCGSETIVIFGQGRQNTAEGPWVKINTDLPHDMVAGD